MYQPFLLGLGSMNSLDRGLFWWINGWPEAQSPFWLFWSKGLGHPAVKGLLILIALWLLIRPATRRGGFCAALAWLLANLWTDLWKAAVPFRRPLMELPHVIARVGKGQEFGTASAHSANMMCVAVCFWWCFGWRAGLPWAAAAVLVGISRVYVGAHYPSQVLFGWILGALTAVIFCSTVDAAIRLWQRRRGGKDQASEAPAGDAAGTS